MNNNFEESIKNLINKIDLLPEQDKKNIIEFTENNEWGLALDCLVHQIYEYDIHISKDIFDNIVSLGKKMHMDTDSWHLLKRQTF